MRLLESISTEFYISDSGYFVISQDCFECGKPSKFVLSPEQTKVLFNLLPDLMQDQTTKWTGIYCPTEE